MTSAEQKIWHTVALIPVGKVASYGQIARLCGLPGYARFVGTTLRKLPADTALPWHRVVNAQGRISFPPDSASYQRQQQRLQQEGVIFQQQKIDMRQFQWHGGSESAGEY